MRLIFFILCVTLFIQSNADAYDFSEKKVSSVTVMEKLFFDEYIYDSNQILDLKTQVDEFASPEDVLVGLFQSINALDFDKWLSLWDKLSREKLSSVGPSKFLNLWKTLYQGKDVKLLRKIITEHFVCIEYQVGESKAVQNVFAREKDGSWLVTNDYSEDPIVLSWRTAERVYKNYTK